MIPRKVNFDGHDGIRSQVFQIPHGSDMRKICAFAIVHSDRANGTPVNVNGLLNGVVVNAMRVPLARCSGGKVPISHAISYYETYLESKGWTEDEPDVRFNIARNQRRYDKVLAKRNNLREMLKLNIRDQKEILRDDLPAKMIMKYAGVYHYTGVILPKTLQGARIFGCLLSIATIKLPTEDATGPIAVTRPTRSPLVKDAIERAEADLDEEKGVDLAIDLALIVNSTKAWKMITGVDASRAICLLFDMARKVAKVIVDLEDRGEFTLCYRTSLSCLSKGNVNLYNHLIWTLCDLRKRLRNAANALDRKSAEYIKYWPLAMVLPPATRMLDLDNYTELELLVLSLLKEYGVNATLPRVILGFPLNGGMPLQLEQLSRSVEYMSSRSAGYPAEELLPSSEIAQFRGAAYNNAAAAERLERIEGQQSSGLRARDIFSADNITTRAVDADIASNLEEW